MKLQYLFLDKRLMYSTCAIDIFLLLELLLGLYFHRFETILNSKGNRKIGFRFVGRAGSRENTLRVEFRS